MIFFLKSIRSKIVDLIAFNFVRHTFLEHFKLYGVLIGLALLFVVVPFLFGSLVLGWTVSTDIPELYSSAFDMIFSFLSVDKVSFITVLFVLSFIGNQFAESLAGLQSKRDKMPPQELAVMIERNAGVTMVVASNAFSIVLKILIILTMSFWIMSFFYDIDTAEALKTCVLFFGCDFALFLIQKLLISTTLQDKEKLKINELVKEIKKYKEKALKEESLHEIKGKALKEERLHKTIENVNE